jgi:hypothetical protein
LTSTAATIATTTVTAAITTAVTATVSFKTTVTAIAPVISFAIAAAVTAAITTTSTVAAPITTTVTTAVTTTIPAAITAAIPAFFSSFGLTYRLVFKTRLGLVFKSFALFAFEFFFKLFAFCCLGLAEFIGHTQLFQSATSRQLDAVAVIDVNDFHLHLVADLADVIDTADVAAGEFADVAQPIAARQDFDERAEVLDAADSTDVNLADLNRGGGQFDALQRLLGHCCVLR